VIISDSGPHRAQKKIRVLFFDTPPPLQIYILKKSQKEKFNMVRAFKIGANLPKRGWDHLLDAE